MEKRFLLFIVLTMLLLTGQAMVRIWLFPPPPVVENIEQLGDEQDREPEQVDAPPASESAPDEDSPTETDAVRPAELSAQPDPREAEQAAEQRWVTIGSYRHGPLLVTFNSAGAAVERIELTQRDESGRLRFRNLDDQSGYLGHLAPTPAERGCQVNAVGQGTPADEAGLQMGDVITHLDDQLIDGPEQLEALLAETKPSDTVRLGVRRTVDGAEQAMEMPAKLGTRPFQMVQPEPLEPDEVAPHPLSYLLSLTKIGDLQIEQGQLEIPGLPSQRTGNWDVKEVSEPAAIEFHFQLDNVPGTSGPLQLIKRFRLGTPTDVDADTEFPAYHLVFELEIVNRGDQLQEIAYRLDGPNGLPLEGWWYSHKIHPRMFKGAGARDVVIRTPATGGVAKRELHGTSEIFKSATKDDAQTPTLALFTAENLRGPTPPDERTLVYVGVDTQYFLAAMLPDRNAPPAEYEFSSAEAMALGELELKRRGKMRTVNVSFQLDSLPIEIPAGETYDKRFLLYSGPKKPQVLAAYGLQDTIYYGWFGLVSRPLSQILHFFYRIVSNYGLAIILLTVLVRSCMFPLSRKAAKNAAMMQELAPEMKKITEKYKTDMEKRAKAQQDLFRKHNYNPLGGCWLMFLQLPVFLGLYRCLSVDIELRQAALIPGLAWCSNLAGPDKLLNWQNEFMGLFTETGMLGPYLNVLPIVTIGMFLVHQKLFMPPATDEQTRMQMQMMKFMMLFMGVMFFKVASGLCLYFIASSLWGIAERKLLPKSKAASAAQSGSGGAGGRGGSPGGGTRKTPPPRSKPPAGGGSNGSNPKRARAKRNRRR